MVSAGRSRVWLRVGETRIRADKVTTITPGIDQLLLRVTGVRDVLAVEVPAGTSGTGRDVIPSTGQVRFCASSRRPPACTWER